MDRLKSYPFLSARMKRMVPNLVMLKQLFEEELIKSLDKEGHFSSKRLNEAILYALISPGKRVRPLLVLAAALSCGGKSNPHSVIRMVMPAALSVEYLHTYSLIHDDLPPMDNDDSRRGRPSVHRRFDEATAILAGDALLADAFFFASCCRYQAVSIVRELSLTAGSSGLAAGQSEDLIRENQRAGFQVWLKINQAKTARLFEACAVIGAMAVDAPKQQAEEFREFGRSFGIAFQLKDDLDDEMGIVNAASKEALIGLLRDELARAQRLGMAMPHNEQLLSLLHLIFASCV
jgi:geranylgeranyl diphosphate synthase type II